jgi:hypothetical protein
MNLPDYIARVHAWPEFDFGFNLGVAHLAVRGHGIIYF